MMSFKRAALCAWLLLTVLLPTWLRSAPAAPSEISVADFFRPPLLSSPRLNPAGTHLALAVFEEKTDSRGLRILDLATHQAAGMRGTAAYDLQEFRWVGNDRLIFTVSRDNLYASGLYSIQRDCVREPRLINGRDAVQIMGSPQTRPDHAYIWVRRSARDDGRPGPLVELDLNRNFRRPFDEDYSQVTRSVPPPPGDSVQGWMTDRTGEIRYARSQLKGQPLFSRLDGDKWVSLNLDLDRLKPLAVDSDPSILLVARLTENGHRELVRMDTRDGSMGPVLYQDEKYDFGNGGVIFAQGEQEIAGITYAQHAPAHFWLRAEDAQLQQMVDASLPAERVNMIVSRSRDGSRIVVRSSSDRHPGTLYLVEPNTHKATAIGNLASWLPEKLLAPVMVTTYRARDGLKLDAYVTLPLNYVQGQPAPMIVLPHGGPWVRDTWGYDPESQFFASRGYVVFRPNYRGSTGYNADISLKSRMEFMKMHEDVTDGVKALIQAKIADPAHLAIVGASFGGYLALCGVAYEPELYRCAVSVAGVFDWARVMRDARSGDPDSARFDFLFRNLGDPKLQQAKFEAMSPITAVDRIKVPVFVAHGETDQVADSSQSHRLVRALKKVGVPHETMFASEEGHGFAALKNRVELYTRIESFLKKNL